MDGVDPMTGHAVSLPVSTVLALAGGTISVLGAAVVSLVLYSFKQHMGSLKGCVNSLHELVESLQGSMEKANGQHQALELRLQRIEAEHALRATLCPGLHRHQRCDDPEPRRHRRDADAEGPG